MQKTLLAQEIEAYAVAAATGNALLFQRQGKEVCDMLAKLPDEIAEIEPAPAPEPTTEP